MVAYLDNNRLSQWRKQTTTHLTCNSRTVYEGKQAHVGKDG
jgi:hypothetical protein